MLCSVCRHPQRAQIGEDWAYTGSLRKTAYKYGIGYRSLQRHLDYCISSICAEIEQSKYEAAFKEFADILRVIFRPMKKKPPRSIITKPIEYTWSRRAWNKRNKPKIEPKQSKKR